MSLDEDGRRRHRRRRTRVPELSAGPVHVTALPGGLTNRNYRVVAASGRQAVVRLSIAAVVRCSRSIATPSTPTPRAAAAAGVAPEVLGYAAGPRRAGHRMDRGPDLRRGRPRRQRDARAGWRRPAGSCTPGRGSPPTSTCSTLQRRYLDLVVSQRLPAAADYLDFMPQVDGDRVRRCARAAAAAPCPATTTCSPANIMASDERIVVHRLRVLRQRRPVLRARQHLQRVDISAPTGSTELVAAYYGGRAPRRRSPGPGCSR